MKGPILAAALLLLLSTASASAQDPIAVLTDNPTATLPVAEPATTAISPVEVKTAIQPATADTKPATVVSTAGKPSKLDLAALYYYAGQKQEARVKAEFERLRFKFPGFEMPTDLTHPEEKKLDDTALWSLYGKDDIAGIEAEIASRKAADPGWAPTQDFAVKFARKKLRLQIDAAAKAKDWSTVAAAGASLDPTTEKEVDLIWNVIDAYSALGNRDAMGRAYRALLFRDPAHAIKKSEIITTIQKATRDFASADIQAVMARFSGDPEVMAGLANISADLVRRRVGEFNADAKQTAPLAKPDIDALRAAAAGKDGMVSDFSLLGWYYLKIKEPAEAGAWFRRALDAEEDVVHAKGLYLALVQQDRREEAYQLALRYREALASDPLFLANALAERFTKPQGAGIDPAAAEAFAAAIIAAKSSPHAEILAWYAYNSGQFQAARAWFTKSFDWKPGTTNLKGLALATGQMGDRPALVALYQQYATQYPAIWDDVHLNKNPRKDRRKSTPLDRMQVGAVDRATQARPAFLDEDVRTARPVQRRIVPRAADTSGSVPGNAATHLGAKRYGDCLSALQGTLSAEASLTKGWCLLGLNRSAEAAAAFSGGLGGSPKTRTDAAYGLAITNLRAGLTSEAESVLSLYPLTPARDSELRLQIYWQKARAAFDHGDYQQTLNALNARLTLKPEPVDMTELRGWAHMKLGHFAEARAIFENLAAYSNNPAARRGLEAASNPSVRGAR